jgi:PilZ domain
MTDTATPPRTNRRLTARKACLLSVRYRTAGGWHPATALDLSVGGCRLRLGEDLAPGTSVEVAFETAPQDGVARTAAEVDGAVSWCHVDGLSRSAGIRFDGPTPALEDLLAAIP